MIKEQQMSISSFYLPKELYKTILYGNVEIGKMPDYCPVSIPFTL